MDVRGTFSAVLRKWGHDIILQRKIRPAANSGIFGLEQNHGFTEKLERHTVRRRYARTARLPYNYNENPEGWTHDPTQIYYFKWDVNPGEGDRIYEEDPSQPGGYTTWLISEIFGERGKGGRIEYWICGVLREQPV